MAIQKSLNKNLSSIAPSILSLILNDAVQYLEDNCNCPPDSLSLANEIEYDCPPDSLSLANEIPTQEEYDWSDQRDEVDCLYDQLEGSFDEASVSDLDEASVSDLDETSVSDQEFDRELKKVGAEWQSYVLSLENERESFTTPRKKFDFYSTPCTRTEKMPSIPSMTAAQKENQDNELLRLLQSD